MDLLFVLLACIALVVLALVSVLLDKRDVFKYRYVQPKSFMKMYNGDVDPCDFHKETIDCGDYIHKLSFVVKDNWYDRH